MLSGKSQFINLIEIYENHGPACPPSPLYASRPSTNEHSPSAQDRQGIGKLIAAVHVVCSRSFNLHGLRPTRYKQSGNPDMRLELRLSD